MKTVIDAKYAHTFKNDSVSFKNDSVSSLNACKCYSGLVNDVLQRKHYSCEYLLLTLIPFSVGINFSRIKYLGC